MRQKGMNHHTDKEDGRPPPDFEVIKTTLLGSLLGTGPLYLPPEGRFNSPRLGPPSPLAHKAYAQKARRLGQAPAP